MFGLKVITNKRFKGLINKGLKVFDLRDELFQTWMEIYRLKKEKNSTINKLANKSLAYEDYERGLVSVYSSKILQLEKELKSYKDNQEVLNEEQNKELNKLTELPQRKYCMDCKQEFYVTEKKFFTFKQKLLSGNITVFRCEDCVKLHKLNSKEK